MDISLTMVIALALLTATIAAAFWRVRLGPTLPDRVVALDILPTVGIGITAVYAVATEQDVWLDAATVIALSSFLGTIAFAYYIDLRRR